MLKVASAHAGGVAPASDFRGVRLGVIRRCVALREEEERKMGGEIVKLWGAARRDDYLWFDPEDLVIVGLDGGKEDHPLHDADRLGRLKRNERLVRNIMVNGVIQPVVVRMNGTRPDGRPNVEVVAGKNRVFSAREANRRLLAEGKERVLVPAMRRRGDVADMYGIMVAENELREADGPMARARKIAKYLSMGRSEAEAEVQFGVSRKTLSTYQKLLGLHPEVRARVEEGTLAADIAAEVAAFPEEEQPGKLREIEAEGRASGRAGLEAAREVRRGRTATQRPLRMVTRARAEKWKAALSEVEGRDARLALAVVERALGKKGALAEYPKVEAAIAEAEKTAR